MIRSIIIGLLVLWSIGILITIALITRSAPRIVRRGAASRSSLSAVADDPFLYPFGEMPTIPRERLMAARDFRAWGIPEASLPSSRPFTRRDLDFSASAGALRRNESGGRPACRSGTAVVLTFPKPLTAEEAQLLRSRQFQLEATARAFGGSVEGIT